MLIIFYYRADNFVFVFEPNDFFVAKYKKNTHKLLLSRMERKMERNFFSKEWREEKEPCFSGLESLTIGFSLDSRGSSSNPMKRFYAEKNSEI